MSLVVVTNADRDGHFMGTGHPERPARSRAALDGLIDAGLADAEVFVPARPATRAELMTVHEPRYLDALEGFCADGGGMVDHAPTSVVPESWETARLAAGAGLVAVESLRAGDGDAAVVVARPPGHHAIPEGAMGFCLFNNIAIAARALVDAGERVLVVDWDVHHGNGTQDTFWNEPRVLFVSVHQEGIYPGTGSYRETGGPDAPGTTINVPLPAGATGDSLLAAIDELVVPAADRFSPTWVLVSAGFDGHRNDDLAELRYASADFADAATRVRSLAPGAGRTILFLEGGYDLDAVRLSMGASAAATLGERFRPEPATAGGPGVETVQAIAGWWSQQDVPAGGPGPSG